MYTLLKMIAGLLIASIIVLVILGLALSSDQPTVDPSRSLSHQHIAQVRQAIKQHLAAQQPGQALAQIRLTEQDLNVVVNYLLQRTQTQAGAANITLMPQALVADVSFPLAYLNRYLNARLQIKTPAGQPQIERVSMGEFTVPTVLGRWLVLWVMQQIWDADLQQQLQSMHIQEQQLELVYRYDPALVRRVRQKVLNLGDHTALQAYVNQLHTLQQQPVGRQRQLTPLLQSLFLHAQVRSENNPPAQENAALLTVLGLWAGRQKLADYVSGQAQEPKSFNFKLHRRIDAARHFLLSAAFAARGDHRLARAIGISKELADAETQSGFSFVDLAANEAGIAFGLLATQSAQSARYVQRFMSADSKDVDIMPSLSDLPENMDQPTFQQRFGAIDTPEYQKMMQEIQRRLDTCLIYQYRKGG